VNTLPTLQGAQIRTLSSRAHGAPALALALAALLALLLTAGLGLIDAAQAQGPAIRYVDADAPGPTHDGLSWTTAYTTVQDALDVANNPANATTIYEIWVAAGVYYLNDREESFRLNHDNVRLYGGFAGSETARDQRDWAAHVTVLSGDVNGDGAPYNNAFHVLYLDGENDANITADTVIDGFTVTGGSATLLGDPPHGSGGGLYCAGDGSGG